MTCKDCMTDRERELWVNNDECLYDNFEDSGLELEKFVSQNRDIIDEHILEASK